MIKTVVFDLGGTLIEYAGLYTRWPELETPGFQAAYASLSQNGRVLAAFDQFRDAGFSLLPQLWQAAVRHEKNLRVMDLLAATLEATGINDVNQSELRRAAELYGEAIQAQAHLIDTAVSTVKQVKAAGYKVGLVSNTMFPGNMHKADMTRFGLIPYFDALVFSADVFKWKPNADPFVHVLAALEAEAATAVYVGDDPASDIVGAQAAGMHSVYFHGNDRFTKPNGVEPDAEINHLGELIPILQKWSVTC